MADFNIDPFCRLSEGEQVIVKVICKIQINSLCRVLKNSWKNKKSKVYSDYNTSKKNPDIESISKLIKIIDDQVNLLKNEVSKIPNSKNNLDTIIKNIKDSIEKQSRESLGIKSITPKLKKLFGAKEYKPQFKTDYNTDISKEFNQHNKFQHDIKMFKNKFFKQWFKNFNASLNKFKIENEWFNSKLIINEISKLKIEKI